MLRPSATILSLSTTNMEAMHAFYTVLLGPPRKQVSKAFFFELPGCNLALWPGEKQGNGSLELTLRVDDLEVARESLPGLEASPIIDASHGREFFIRDPDGHTVIIYEQDRG